MRRTPHRMAAGALIVMGAVAAAGCSNEKLPGPEPGEPDFVITVRFPQGSNVTPEYSWDVGDVSSVRVTRTEAFADPAWIIAAENNAGDPVNRIASPLTHGTAPSGVDVLAANELQLEPGMNYQVTVARADRTAGFVEFTCCN